MIGTTLFRKYWVLSSLMTSCALVVFIFDVRLKTNIFQAQHSCENYLGVNVFSGAVQLTFSK
jgi:hypothetical protein